MEVYRGSILSSDVTSSCLVLILLNCTICDYCIPDLNTIPNKLRWGEFS